MAAKQIDFDKKQVEEGTEALRDLKKYLKSANIQDEENWRLRSLLNRLGLTKYESEAYIGLVQGGTLTVKELVQKTGIPQSRSYDTLGKLVKYGMVEQTTHLENKNGRKEKRFRSVEPEIAVKNLFSYFIFAKDEAIVELQKIKSKKSKTAHIWEIHDKKNIIQTAKNLIRRADYEIFLIADYEMFEELRKEIFKAKDQRINLTCISTRPKDLEDKLGFYWNEYLRIKTIKSFPMPYLIIDHKKALVWSRDLFDSQNNDEYFVAQLIEGREWVSTLADHFFLSHWNMGKAISTSVERKNFILPKTFVHIHTALAETTYLLKNNIKIYTEVTGRNKDGVEIILSGEIIKLKKEWSQGISTIIIKPDDEKYGIEFLIGGKFAIYEDLRMDKIIIDDAPFMPNLQNK